MKETIAHRFGRCIRALREEAGFTQEVFGERCGFYQTYLSRIENGKANPSLHAMEVLATSLGLSIYELWERVRLLERRRTSGKKSDTRL